MSSHPFRKAIFTGYYKATGRSAVLDGVERYKKFQYASRDELDALSRTRLASILTHATETVPYFRELLGSQKVSEASAVETLRGFPILTKGIIREQGPRLFSEKPGTKPGWNTSGGSTGEPVRLRQDRDMGREHRSVELMYLDWAGHKMGEPHVLIWGVPKETVGEGITFHERVFRFACNQTYLNCYRMTEEILKEWVQTINQRKPTVIEAYVDAIGELSSWINKTGAKIHSPRGIITSAGVLTEDARKSISKAFGAPIYNRYGSREVANVACACKDHTELHVNEPWCYFEIVNDDGDPCDEGEEGHILITVYANRTMPLIRYRIEDRGVWASSSPCSCGRTTRRLASVCGRMSDYLVAADGVRINGTALTTLLYEVQGIKRFQYRQSADGKVVLAAVPVNPERADALKADLARPARELAQLLNGRPVDVAIVDEILPAKSGKFRYILNEMAASDWARNRETTVPASA